MEEFEDLTPTPDGFQPGSPGYAEGCVTITWACTDGPNKVEIEDWTWGEGNNPDQARVDGEDRLNDIIRWFEDHPEVMDIYCDEAN